MNLPYAHGEPALDAVLRAEPEHFFVEEDLGFMPSGQGEHVVLYLEKRQLTTFALVGRISKLARVRERDISFSGMKDKQAVTRQWFSVHMPRGVEPDWNELQADGQVRVLVRSRHSQKLRRGVHKGNSFRLLLTGVKGNPEAADTLLQRIRDAGVPNYFGEQRFGRDGGNLAQAEAMFATGEGPKDRRLRGIFLSAARSELFNQVLAARVRGGSWNRPLQGDLMSLAGTRSHFLAEQIDEELENRAATGDISPSGPLWGLGELGTGGEVRALEQQALAPYASVAAGLEASELLQDRRALRLWPRDFSWEWTDQGLALSFWLPRGGYATAVIRELARTNRQEDETTGE